MVPLFLAMARHEKLSKKANIRIIVVFLLKFFLNFFCRDGWDGNNWTKNGPFLITRLIKELCKTDNIISLYSGSADCGNISIYPPDTFGPIPWFKWKFFFDPTKNEFVTEKMKKSLAVHFWNKLSKINPVIPNSNQPYANIASKSCPKVFRTVIDNF